MEKQSLFSYFGTKLHQVAFVVKDIEAAQKFFNEKLGVPRFHVIHDFSVRVKDKTYRGKPADHHFKIALTYSGETQLELCQHVSGDTCYRDFLERKGEGLHHIAFFLDDPGRYDQALGELQRNGFPVLMSGRVGALRFAYLDTEAAIGSLTEVVYVDERSKEFFARIKRGDF
jgi:catechol 2,3-dioxygenase-like lactoylglutathione lyase family enzyme